MQYRPHIDGLRTIAVLPVVLYHLGSPYITGGFIGVDVFFVVSGYLITSILLDDMDKERYSIFRFYQRRILRILPALSAVLLATFVLSGFLFFPSEQAETGKSIAAAAVFGANFFFWGDSGYFAAPAETKPLLHMWSLAVEEQFYIFFPILLWFLYRSFPKRMLSVIMVLSIISFALCIVMTFRHQPTAFYLLPTRAWELGIGAGLAIWAQGRELRQGSGLIALIGAVLVILPMFFLSSESLFPGWNAAPPVLGTALLLWWGHQGWIGRVLSWAPMVYVGRTSYSLYLWHWPVIVFWKAYSGESLSALEMVLLGSVSFALAVVSLHVIEKPFRTAKARAVPASKVVTAGGMALAGFAGLGLLGANGHGGLRSLPDEVVRIASFVDYTDGPDRLKQFRDGVCQIGQGDGGFEAFEPQTCAVPSTSELNMLVIGDSHAAQFWGALDQVFPDINVMQATASGCRPILETDGRDRCLQMRSWVFEEFLPNNQVDVIVMGGRWREEEAPYVTATLEHLQQFADKIVLIGPTVEYEGEFPVLLARSQFNGEDLDFDRLQTPGRDRVNGLMRSAAQEAEVEYLDLIATECPSGECVLFAPDGGPMKFDYGHLTLSGAQWVIESHADLFVKEP